MIAHGLLYGAIFLAVSAVALLWLGGIAIDWAAGEETQDGSL